MQYLLTYWEGKKQQICIDCLGDLNTRSILGYNAEDVDFLLHLVANNIPFFISLNCDVHDNPTLNIFFHWDIYWYVYKPYFSMFSHSKISNQYITIKRNKEQEFIVICKRNDVISRYRTQYNVLENHYSLFRLKRNNKCNHCCHNYTSDHKYFYIWKNNKLYKTNQNYTLGLHRFLS